MGRERGARWVRRVVAVVRAKASSSNPTTSLPACLQPTYLALCVTHSTPAARLPTSRLLAYCTVLHYTAYSVLLLLLLLLLLLHCTIGATLGVVTTVVAAVVTLLLLLLLLLLYYCWCCNVVVTDLMLFCCCSYW